MIFSAIAIFKTDAQNTKKWLWHHDRCIAPSTQIEVLIPRQEKNIHDCYLHHQRNHKIQPKGYAKVQKRKKQQKQKKAFEPHIIPNRNKPENKDKYYAKMLHINPTNWDNQIYPFLHQNNKKLDIECMELIMPKFQNTETQELIVIQGLNFDKLSTQLQYLEKKGFVPQGTELIKTNEIDHNS